MQLSPTSATATESTAALLMGCLESRVPITESQNCTFPAESTLTTVPSERKARPHTRHFWLEGPCKRPSTRIRWLVCPKKDAWGMFRCSNYNLATLDGHWEKLRQRHRKLFSPTKALCLPGVPDGLHHLLLEDLQKLNPRPFAPPRQAPMTKGTATVSVGRS